MVLLLLYVYIHLKKDLAARTIYSIIYHMYIIYMAYAHFFEILVAAASSAMYTYNDIIQCNRLYLQHEPTRAM